MHLFRSCFFARLGLLVLLVAALPSLSGCGARAPSPEPPLLEAKAWRMERVGPGTLAEAQSATDWQPYHGLKGWGFGPETIWIKARLKAGTGDPAQPWAVRVRPAFLDYVTLHDPAAGLTLHAGDAIPPSDDTVAAINFTFQIPALSREREIYLQVRSTSTRVVQLEVLPSLQAQRKDRLQEWGMGVFVAVSLAIAIWALTHWWTTREPVIGAFALKQLLAVLWAFFILGYARIVVGPLLPEGVLTTLASTTLAWMAGVTMAFLAMLVGNYHPARWAQRVCAAFALALLLLPSMQVFGLTREMLLLLNASLPLVYLTLIGTLITALPARSPQPIAIGWVLAFLCVTGSLVSTPVLIHLGLMREHPIVMLGVGLSVLVDSVGMFVLLRLRERALKRQQHRLELELARTREQADAARKGREEQSRLVTMLAHEMKTPLAALSMWTHAGRLEPAAVQRAVAAMNQVIERCVHTGQLDDEGLRPTPVAVDPVELTRSCILSCRDPDRVDLSVPQTAPVLQADAQMLGIVLANLLDNACKYGAPDGRVEVTLQPAIEGKRAGCRWEVRNAIGPAGVPEADRLFEKYYRGSQARRLSGSGLGLFLVHGLLELMYGSVRFEVQAGRAVFSVWLPGQQPAA